MKIIQDKSLKRWKEYKALRLRSLKDTPQAFESTIEETEKISQKEWHKRLKNMYFAEIDGKWVGMIGARTNEKEKLSHIINVYPFYVMPKYRSRGIGRVLLSRIIEEAKKDKTIKKLQFGVITTQKPALNLYLSLGFKKVGKRKYAIKIGNKYFDKYLMELYIN